LAGFRAVCPRRRRFIGLAQFTVPTTIRNSDVASGRWTVEFSCACIIQACNAAETVWGTQMTRFRLPVALIFGIAFAAAASAQNYPNRPITFVVPFAVGGLSDVPARVLAAVMQERMGASIVVENKTGGSGVIGASHVLRAEPDGYTLLVNALADVQNLHYIPVAYDAVNDFALVGKVTEGPPLVLIIDAKLPYKTLAELIAGAKANPDKLSFGTSGPASSPVIALTQLNAAAGTKIQDVPYRGSGQAASSVVTGAIQGTFTFYTAAKPLVDGGQARALAVASVERMTGWPDVPTMDELGFPGFDHRGFVGLAAPAKTPPQIIALLNRHLNEAINADAFKTRMEALGMTIPKDNTPEKFAQFMRQERDRQAQLAKLSGYAPMAPQQPQPAPAQR
jgi:tripartite-type tricarboxylate transporter receptor subunit TctC